MLPDNIMIFKTCYVCRYRDYKGVDPIRATVKIIFKIIIKNGLFR